MVTLNLEKIFDPETIALVGASDEEGSVGHILMKNLTELEYEGKIYSINICMHACHAQPRRGKYLSVKHTRKIDWETEGDL